MAMASPAHRSSHSLSSNGSYASLLTTPQQPTRGQRRMSSPTLPPLPGQAGQHAAHEPPSPRSPLHQAVLFNPSPGGLSHDGSPLPQDGDPWGQRSTSPVPSITQYASHLVNRVGSLMSNMSSPPPSQSPRLLTDAELEADAERERERSRREAQRIMEAEHRVRRDRLQVEENVMAMLDRGGRVTPVRSQTMPMPEPVSPATSQKEGIAGLWAAAKTRLTPTKETLTPAQQIIQDAKKLERKKGRDKSPGNGRADDSPLRAPPFVGYGSYSPSMSPTNPGRQNFSASTPALVSSGDGPPSTSQEQVPIYAQFGPGGNLNVHSTLLVIAKRFEKLEKWTVGHVRALEERMADVERWLVDKEKEKEDKEEKRRNSISEEPSSSNSNEEMQEIRDELVELQARLGEMGREMARLATAPSNLSSGPAKTASPQSAPQTNSSIASRQLPSIPLSQPHPQYQRVVSPTSTPPRATTHKAQVSSSSTGKAGSRTRLPYPTGDYTSPDPDGSILGRSLSPALDSPTSSIKSNSRMRPMSVAGLPPPSEGLAFSKSPSPSSSPSGLPEPSPVARVLSPSGGRKRYTVALGGPLTAPPEARTPERVASPIPDLEAAFFSESEESAPKLADSLFINHWEDNDVTIGRAASRRSQAAIIENPEDDDDEPTPSSSANASPSPALAAPSPLFTSPSPSPTTKGRYNPNRIRAQSSYGAPAGFSLPSPSVSPSPSPKATKPLHTRMRSQSQDRSSTAGSLSHQATGNMTTALNTKFVDPVLVRRQNRNSVPVPSTPKAVTGKRAPVGELVAFFDQERGRQV